MTEESHSAFHSKRFRIYLGGNLFSVLGIWVQRLALGWQAWELSQSALVVGVVAAAQFMPTIVFTPFFGVMVDRISPRIGAIVMHVILTLISFLLAGLTLAGLMTTEWLLTLALMNGISNSAYAPIRLALIPQLVTRAQFPSAAAITATLFNLSRFVGPGVGGAIVAWYGLGYAYLVNAITYIPVVFALMAIHTDPRGAQTVGPADYFGQLVEGIRYTRRHSVIFFLILLTAVSNFFGRGMLELMPAFAALVFDGDSTVLAALMSAIGVGAITASLLLTRRFMQRRLRLVAATGAIGVGMSIALFGTVESLPAGVGVAALLGMFASLVSISSQTEVQLEVEDRLRGRVMSLWSLVIMGAPAVGSVIGGALAGEAGATPTSYVFGTACLGMTALLILRRSLRPAVPPSP
ncbi:MAG: MFS transporter [Woeseiaceae bacterium]|nr:MFS transporter [Woeseiaceae bacterium]